ncbi:hypothetical protein [Fodinicola feengrottensis]|uniref:hypothetical protein n=1 Tax=Fodinicola feengrottensis TaxID=435914 RepID=UPI0024419CA5|nr:hypothetical protein [Fodinicola feengrottensis]
MHQPPSVADGGREMLAWLREMRDNEPVSVDQYGMYHVFRYDDVQKVTTDPAVFSNDFTRIMPQIAEGAKGNLLAVDPPVHRKLRQFGEFCFHPENGRLAGAADRRGDQRTAGRHRRHGRRSGGKPRLSAAGDRDRRDAGRSGE